MKKILEYRQLVSSAAAVVAVLWWSTTASAQLDPLLFLRRVPPTVILAMDTSTRMLDDGSGRYYDPNTYVVADDPAVSAALGLNILTTGKYRRIYTDLLYETVQDSSSKFEATNILAVGNDQALYSTFWFNTRLEVAKRGVDAALSEYAGNTYRFGLLKLRQNSPQWRTGNNCDKPVRVTGNPALADFSDSNPCSAGSAGKYGVYTPEVGSNQPNYQIEVPLGGGAQVVATGAGTQTAIRTVVQRSINDASGLIPAGMGARDYADRPIAHLLDDARTAATNAMANDSAALRSCRNTVVVLIVGGKDDGDANYRATHSAPNNASTFLAVSGGGVTKRVPIHVIAIRPSAADEASLQSIAANSGGIYRNVSTSANVTAAIHHAVQTGFSRAPEFDTGSASEFVPVSPVIGTVNIKNARSATGVALPDTDIIANPGGQPLPQRSNLLLTAGFTLPGFDGVLRAFRTYRPVADTTKPTGWKFVSDGTRLWPDLDGRPMLAGKARVPAAPSSRNIYTYIPNGAGGGNVVAFTADNAPALTLPMQTGSSTASVIDYIRSLPLGAVIGSTPAIMDVPSLDPPPDDQYGRPDAVGSFAYTYKNRRSLIFVGANDGMIHAIDTRTGYEVWAFIPYNLLPKLRTLVDGQSVEQFDYFVDSSPKIAEVKINGDWRSLLIIGQGPGGTFYQAFDVTIAGMGVAPDRDDISAVTDLLATFDTPNESIQFKWAYPNYNSFDPTYTATLNVTDGTPGGKVKLYGDLLASASYAEKTVGFSWSDPAVGPLNQARTTNAVIVGSGYFPAIESLIPSRGATAPPAGNALYLLNADTGLLLGNASGNSCPEINGSGSGSGCVSIGDANNGRKNALQADPTAAGLAASLVVTKAYLGDVDGKYWRFDFTETGSISATQMVNTLQPIYASSALLFVGTADVYMFFATGSDLLPAAAPGGTGTFKLWGLRDNAPGPGATVKFSRDLTAVTLTNGLATGERPSVAPSVAGDIVFYTTTNEAALVPCSDYTSKLYAVTYVGSAAYDSNNSGKLESNESPVVRTMAGRATAPFIVDQHLYVATSGNTGAAVEAFGDPEDFNNGIGQVGVRILSWREIR
jgi:Neisseria PilC beta-propeller domain